MTISSILKWATSGFKGQISWPMTANRQIYFPDKDGTVMLEGPIAIVVIVAGESNVGGTVPVSSLPNTELQPSKWIDIWNNSANVFQPLQIGANNLIGHTGLTDNTTAGIELGLSRAQSTIGLNKIYLIKCGHGGSTIAQWSEGNPTNYWSLLVSRYNQAKAVLELQGFSVRPVFIWWLGLNDAGVGTLPATWQSETQTLFSKARQLLGNGIPIHPVKLQTNAPNSTERAALNAAITSIAGALPNIFPIELPTGVEQQTDGSHFARQGYVSILNAIVESALLNRSFGEVVNRGARPGPPGNSPRVVAVCETVLTLAHNVMTPVPFSPTASVDRDGVLDYTLNAIRIPSWGAGEYLVCALGGVSVACTRVQVLVRINGVDWHSSPLSLHPNNVVFTDIAAGATLFLAAGDLITLHILQVNTTSATRSLLVAPAHLRAQIHLTRFST